MSTVIFKKFSPKVSRGTQKNCELCHDKFGTFKKEHQCKRCYRAICKQCGHDKREIILSTTVKEIHRVCINCRTESDLLKEYIKVNKLEFAKDSIVGKKWLEKITVTEWKKESVKESKIVPFEVFNKLWDFYNFSLREFIGLLTFNKNQMDIHKIVNNVFLELQNRGLEENMETLVLLIMFTLCFSSSKSCVHLVEFLCILKSNVIDQKQVLHTYLKTLGIEENLYKQLNTYISYQCVNMLDHISVNAATAEASIDIVSKAFEKQRIDENYMLLAIVLQENFADLLRNGNASKMENDYLIIKNCNLANYGVKFKKLATVNVAQMTSIRAKKNSIGRETSEILEFIINSNKKVNESEEKEEGSSFSKKNTVIEEEIHRIEEEKKVENNDKSEGNLQNDENDEHNNEKGKMNKKEVEEEEVGRSLSEIRQEKEDNWEREEKSMREQIECDNDESWSSNEERDDEEVKEGKQYENKESMDGYEDGKKEQSEQIKYDEEQKMENETEITSLNEIIKELIKENKEIKEMLNVERELSNAVQVLEDEITKLKMENEMLREMKGNNDERNDEKKGESNEEIQKFKIKIDSLEEQLALSVRDKDQGLTELNSIKQELILSQKENENLKKRVEEEAQNNQALKEKLEESSNGLENGIKKLSQEYELLKAAKAKDEEENKAKIDSLEEQLALSVRDKDQGLTELNSIKQELILSQKENENLKKRVEEEAQNNQALKEKSLEIFSSTYEIIPPTEHTLQNEINPHVHHNAKNPEELGISQTNYECFEMTLNNPTETECKLLKLEKERTELINKLKDLSDIIVNEESEKYSLSQELFEVRRMSNSSKNPFELISSNLTNVEEKSPPECIIF